MFHDLPTRRNRVWQTDFSEFETTGGGIWRICAVIDYATKYCLAATVTPTSCGADALYRGVIGDGDALAVEVGPFRQVYNTVRPHQALGDRIPRAVYCALREVRRKSPPEASTT